MHIGSTEGETQKKNWHQWHQSIEIPWMHHPPIDISHRFVRKNEKYESTANIMVYNASGRGSKRHSSDAVTHGKSVRFTDLGQCTNQKEGNLIEEKPGITGNALISTRFNMRPGRGSVSCQCLDSIYHPTGIGETFEYEVVSPIRRNMKCQVISWRLWISPQGGSCPFLNERTMRVSFELG